MTPPTLQSSLRRGLPAVLVGLALLVGTVTCSGRDGHDHVRILNASYDTTRQFYREINAAFAEEWREATGQTVTIRMSHAGSGSQARAVIDGLRADVVTLALAADIDAIARHARLLPEDWQERLPHGSAPYSSTLAFLVREGNPKGIHTWEDLAREGVEVITPNPKTSGAARWNYLAIWGGVLRSELGPDFAAMLQDPVHAEAVAAAQERAREVTARVYRNVPVLDAGARGSTNTFIQRGMGDVLINWENEILLGGHELDQAGVEIVTPPVSILAEPPVAMLDAVVDQRGTREVAGAYLDFLYSRTGQEIAARNYFRPVTPEILEEYSGRFPDLELFTVEEVFGGWTEANRLHFQEGASFDQIYAP